MLSFWQKLTTRRQATLLVTCACLLFFVVGIYFVPKGSSLFLALPFVLFIGFICSFYLEKLPFLIAFFTPLSISLCFGSNELSMPSEPLLIFAFLLLIVKVFKNQSYDLRIVGHPVVLSVLFYLLWMIVATAFSSMPIVSLKYTISQLWFILPCFFVLIPIFKDPATIRTFYWAYGLSFLGVIIYASVMLIAQGFTRMNIHFIMMPFYKDHTIYGAALGLFFPVFCFAAWDKTVSFRARLFGWLALAIVVLGIVLSFTRGTWVSIALAALFFGVVVSRIKLRYIVALMSFLLLFFFLFQADIQQRFSRDTQTAGIEQQSHMGPFFNLSTDPSSLERVNRWTAAIQMFKEKPVFGWGPRTYQFQYAPFQQANRLSEISNNFGLFGNAHSEYFGPLAELGLPGALGILAIFGMTIFSGIRTYRRAINTMHAKMALSLTLALFTYYIHGLFNNFLDTDKLSVPFWGFTAAIVALDLFSPKSERKKPKNNSPITI